MAHLDIKKLNSTRISHFYPTRICRAALAVLLMLVGVVNVWGEEEIAVLWLGSTHNQQININASAFPADMESTDLFCIKTSDRGVSNIHTLWGNSVLKSGTKNISQGTYYNTIEERYEIPISDFVDDFVSMVSNQGGLIIATGYEQYLTRISIVRPTIVVDPFINQAASGCAQTRNNPPEELSRDLTSKTISLSGASLTEVKYARIYVVDGKNKPVDPSGGLYSVSCPGATATQAGTNAKNGFYLYTGSELTKSDIQVTLNAGAGNFTKYRIVALLAKDLSTATISSGTMTTEPQWQEEYTYRFTYPVHEEVFFVSEADMNAAYTIINKSSDVLTFFGKTAQQMGNDGWYARWFIRAKGNSDAKQNIDLTNGGQTDNWAIAPDLDNGNWSTWLWAKDGNLVYTSTVKEGQAKNDWYVNRALCHSRIHIPNTYSKLSELSDYEIVYEAAANYTSGDPDITLRYVWKIIPPITFEYDGEIANTVAVTQQMTSATSSEETLDWTTTKASVAMLQTGWKYARFYVVDAEGTAVDPTDNAHKLTVSGGTLCETKESGYYVYNNGSDDITLPTVKLTSTGTVRPRVLS